MKRNILIIYLFSFAMLLGVGGASFADDDIAAHRSCTHCGMDRKAYGYSRMLIHYKDGATVGVCSLHCAVTELDANKGREVKALLVADRGTRKLLDAEKAIWVLGGKKRAVMTLRPKWAFGTQKTAQAFIDEYGGKITGWQEILAEEREESAPKAR